MRDANREKMMQPDKGPVIGAVVFIAVGSVLLLEKLGYLPWGVIPFWPMIFVLVGILKIAYAGARPTGAAFIGLGVILQLNEMGITHLNFWDLWPVLIIVAGVAMLWQALHRETAGVSSNPNFDAMYIFGGGDRQISTRNFKGGHLFAIFGGYKVDFKNADIEGDQAVLDASAIFGGGEIWVPDTWLVSVKGVGVFGAYEDKTRHVQPDPSKPAKTLIIRGVAMFGGIEIKN